MSPSAPLLLRLRERPWAPSPVLRPEALSLSGVAPSPLPERVAVIREAFAPFDAPPRPLGEWIAPLWPGSAAVASLAAKPEGKLLADEYSFDAARGAYVLKDAGRDALRLLQRHGVRLALVPDPVEASRPGAETRLGAVAAARPGAPAQCSDEVLMVAPTAFAFNPQAAQDNSFMHSGKGSMGPRPTDVVLSEYARLYQELADHCGVKVHLLAHDLAHGTPDAVFPNNWFSTHAAGEAAGGVEQGTLVLYPMRHPNRAAERRPDAVAVLKAIGHPKVIDLTAEERPEAEGAHGPQLVGRYLEGTGSIVLDRVAGTAYVALSERADEELARTWAERLGYKDVVTFTSRDVRGKVVYHTNVMMAVGTGVAVVCLDSVSDPEERERLRASLARTHEIVDISLEQMDDLCGNVLELRGWRGLPVMAMSTRAYNAFTEEQREALLRHVSRLAHADVSTLEFIGGGGVRCCLGEIFRP